MQLVRSLNAEPLVQFFCDVISKAPEICACEAIAPTSNSPRGRATSGGGEGVAARLRVEEPWLYAFVALAARILLPQHITPSDIIRELLGSLHSQLHAETDFAFLCNKPAEWQQFQAVGVALVKSKDVLATLSQAGTAELFSETLSGSDKKHEREQQSLSPKLGNLESFDCWIQQLSRELKVPKSKVMKAARMGLTGRKSGLPLGMLVSSLEVHLEDTQAETWDPVIVTGFC